MAWIVLLSASVTDVVLSEARDGSPGLGEQNVLDAVEGVDGVRQARVDWSFDPAWTPENITEDGRDQLLAMGYL